MKNRIGMKTYFAATATALLLTATSGHADDSAKAKEALREAQRIAAVEACLATVETASPMPLHISKRFPNAAETQWNPPSTRTHCKDPQSKILIFFTDNQSMMSEKLECGSFLSIEASGTFLKPAERRQLRQVTACLNISM